MLTKTPDLIGRDEVRDLLSGWSAESWPDEAHSPLWANDEVRPCVGSQVLVCVRVPNGYAWLWCTVRVVRRWRVQVELAGAGPPGSELARSDTFTVDAEHVHVTLVDEVDEAGYREWYCAWRERANHPAAAAATTKDKPL